MGRRIQRTTSAGADERYVYDGQNVIQDLSSSSSVVTSYLNGPGLDNHLRQTNATTGVSYFLTDHLGSTIGLMDSSANLVEQLTYDSFGNHVASGRTRYTYTGRERDADTGLMYYRARFYDPQVGRFINEDPIGLKGGINQYAYVGNNPVSFIDPSGLCPQNPSPTPPAQPLPPNYRPPKPLEQPCIDRTNDVRRDISAIAKTLHGKAGALQQPNKPFPGAQIDPGGQSFGKVVNTLYTNGFSENYSLDHPEGWGFQKKFNDGLWYHVIVEFPKGTDTDLFGNLQLDQRAPTPQITVHCHATNPNGPAHIIDRFFGP